MRSNKDRMIVAHQPRRHRRDSSAGDADIHHPLPVLQAGITDQKVEHRLVLGAARRGVQTATMLLANARLPPGAFATSLVDVAIANSRIALAQEGRCCGPTP